MSNTLYNVYINESGDEGIKRGSKWFVLTAIIVGSGYDNTISNKIVDVKKELNIDRNKELKFSKLFKRYDKMKYIIEKVKDEKFIIMHLAIDTDKLKINKDIDLYSFFISYLIEKVSFFINEKRSIARIFISTRSDYNLIKQDLLLLELTNKRHYHNINQYAIRSIEFVDNNKKNLLQLANVCCNSFSQYIRYNKEEILDLIVLLKDRIRKKQNATIGHGIKIFPDSDLLNSYPDLIKLN